MPNEKVTLYFTQILETIDKIDLATRGLSMETYQDYEIKWIIERGLEIIGEAFKRIQNINPDLNIPNKQKIISTRNKIAHEYDEVDHTILYLIVTKYLPLLKLDIGSIVKKINSDTD